MSVKIRKANQNDGRRVAELAVKLARQHEEYDARRFARLYSEADAEWYYGSRNETADEAVFVAEIDNEIVGFAYLQYEAKNYPALLENAAWLHDIYIEESARKTGAGRLLIEKSVEAALEFGADKLILSVAAKNEAARAFFERRGFRETMIEMMLDLNEK
ncbi:MAG TPA: GNAT family N-acetyltransferase [Pyrinomonadaceae bacterium]|jgi:GNAT superfamily N-acetyltransferase